MGLHDRLKTSNGASAATAEALLSGSPVQEIQAAAQAQILDVETRRKELLDMVDKGKIGTF